MRFRVGDHIFDDIRKESVNFLSDMNLRYFVTLNFRGVRDKELARQVLGKFVKELNVVLFGKRSKKAIRCVPSIERHVAGGCHIHILFEDPGVRLYEGGGKVLTQDEFKELIGRVWEGVDGKTASVRSSCPDGSSWFKCIDSQEGVLSYISKQINFIEQDAIQWGVLNKTGRRHAF